MKSKKYVSITIVGCFLALFIGAIGMYLVLYFFPSSQTVGSITRKNVTISDTGIAEAVEKVYDAVVVVETYNDLQAVSSGSGFVYKTEGKLAYILTNNHVVANGNDIKVKLSNDKTLDAKVVGKETYSDIAVLSVEKDKIISVAELGTSVDSRLGDTVFTVGAPIGESYSGTVTRGILSGKDRLVEVSLSNSGTSDYIMKVIQTDAAINSGNSGGPLVNGNGEVIGITNMKLMTTGVESMGFAIPMEDAIEYATKIEKGEDISRPFIGIRMLDTNDYYNLYTNGLFNNSNQSTTGVVVAGVEEGKSADKAGIQKGDIITEVASQKVTSIAELRYQLYQHNVGDKIKIKYIRDGKENTTEVVLQANESIQ